MQTELILQSDMLQHFFSQTALNLDLTLTKASLLLRYVDMIMVLLNTVI